MSTKGDWPTVLNVYSSKRILSNHSKFYFPLKAKDMFSYIYVTINVAVMEPMILNIDCISESLGEP
jgi:hypothetical protein